MSMEARERVQNTIQKIKDCIEESHGYTLYTHIDADGFGAEFLAKLIFGEPNKVHHIKNLNNLSNIIFRKNDNLSIVTDIGSINKLPDTFKNKIVVIDHHVMSDDNFVEEDFRPFFSKSRIAVERDERIVHIIDNTKSATGMLLQICEICDIELSNFQIVQLKGIDDWDTGHFGNWRSSKGTISRGALISYGIKNFNSLFKTKAKIIEDICTYPEKYAYYKSVVMYFFEELEEIYNEWEKGVDIIFSDKIFIKGGKTIQLPDKIKFAFTSNPQKAFSLFAKEFLYKHIDVDFCINYNEKFSTIELRSFKNNANCFKLAREMGGGGHFHAAGWPVSD